MRNQASDKIFVREVQQWRGSFKKEKGSYVMTHHYNRFIVRIRFDRFTDDCRPFWGNWVRSGGRSAPKYRSSGVAFP